MDCDGNFFHEAITSRPRLAGLWRAQARQQLLPGIEVERLCAPLKTVRAAEDICRCQFLAGDSPSAIGSLTLTSGYHLWDCNTLYPRQLLPYSYSSLEVQLVPQYLYDGPYDGLKERL